MRVLTKLSFLATVITLAACGGGGGTVTINKFAGTYTGTFSWQREWNGVPQGSPITGTANGTVSDDGTVQLDMYIQPAPGYTIDRITGTVSNTTGDCVGRYLYGINPPPSTNGDFPQTSQFSISGDQLTVNVHGVGGGVNNETYEATMILNR